MDKYNIAFDQFQRYETVAQLIEYHGIKTEKVL